MFYAGALYAPKIILSIAYTYLHDCVKIASMKGILLTAGSGTRLRPLTFVVNKTVLPVYNQPMFFYGLKTLVDSGIREIIIVSNPSTKNQLEVLLNFFPLKNKVKVRFVVQKRPLGMVDAIISTKKLVGKSDVVVYSGDNIVTNDYKRYISRFKGGALAFLTKVIDPSRSGCPLYSKDGKLIKIVEKPKHPQTKWIVIGPYIFDNNIFQLSKLLKPSKRGELEITDLLNLYLKSNHLKLYKNKGKWFDAGTFKSLLTASQYISKNLTKFFP